MTNIRIIPLPKDIPNWHTSCRRGKRILNTYFTVLSLPRLCQRRGSFDSRKDRSAITPVNC